MIDSVDELLVRARAAASGDLILPARHRTRVAAWFGRAALEGAVVVRLHAQGVNANAASMRSRLSCLAVLDPPAGDRAATAWVGLSRLCHHHAYELSASHAEVDAHLDAIAWLAT